MSHVLNVMATVFTVKNNFDTSGGRDLFKQYTMSMTKSNRPKKNGNYHNSKHWQEHYNGNYRALAHTSLIMTSWSTGFLRATTINLVLTSYSPYRELQALTVRPVPFWSDLQSWPTVHEPKNKFWKNNWITSKLQCLHFCIISTYKCTSEQIYNNNL